ncbi:hypothetical protein SRHO_G00008150 [Serrasalmus rhombeus]
MNLGRAVACGVDDCLDASTSAPIASRKGHERRRQSESAVQKKGKKGEKRKEKRQIELCMLQLFEHEGQKRMARAEKRGDKTWRKEDSGDDSSDESENGDSPADGFD